MGTCNYIARRQGVLVYSTPALPQPGRENAWVAATAPTNRLPKGLRASRVPAPAGNPAEQAKTAAGRNFNRPWQPPRLRPLRSLPTATTRAYLDTVVVHFHTLPEKIAKMRKLIGALGEKRLFFKKVKGGNHGWLVTLHQPTRKELKALGALQRRTSNHAQPATLHRYDVSVDFFPTGITSIQDLERWLRQTVTVLNSERHPALIYKNTWYSAPTACAFVLVEYSDLPCKLNHKLRCVHFDLRTIGSEAVHRTGVQYADELINLNPGDHWDRHVRHLDYDVEEFTLKFIERDMRKRRAVREKLGKQPSRSNPLYREIRVRGHIKRMELHSVHNLRRAYPHDVAKLAIIPTATFGIPKSLQWGAISLGRHYKKKIETELGLKAVNVGG